MKKKKNKNERAEAEATAQEEAREEGEKGGKRTSRFLSSPLNTLPKQRTIKLTYLQNKSDVTPIWDLLIEWGTRWWS